MARITQSQGARPLVDSTGETHDASFHTGPQASDGVSSTLPTTLVVPAWLPELYQQLNARVAQMGSVCVASGRCCRFDEFGHQLYLTEVEADLLFAQPPPSVNESAGEETPGLTRCPYQVGRQCTARERRPLGCRVYFCDANTQDQQNNLMEEFLGRLKERHLEGGRPWRYASLATWVKEHAWGSDAEDFSSCPAPSRG